MGIFKPKQQLVLLIGFSFCDLYVLLIALTLKKDIRLIYPDLKNNTS